MVTESGKEQEVRPQIPQRQFLMRAPIQSERTNGVPPNLCDIQGRIGSVSKHESLHYFPPFE